MGLSLGHKRPDLPACFCHLAWVGVPARITLMIGYSGTHSRKAETSMRTNHNASRCHYRLYHATFFGQQAEADVGVTVGDSRLDAGLRAPSAVSHRRVNLLRTGKARLSLTPSNSANLLLAFHSRKPYFNLSEACLSPS
jgi:hypothetical protein